VPDIVGGPSTGGGGAAFTVSVNGAKDALKVPSLTLIVIFAKLPTLLAAGVPDSAPVAALKLIQEG
jgi:hypothetical protein